MAAGQSALVFSAIFATLLIKIATGQMGSVRITCFDNKMDVDRAWTASSPFKFADSPSNLPTGYPETLGGHGVWYIEGAGREAREVKLTMTARPPLYTSRSKKVQIYIRYYNKSPRAISLQPIKGPLPLVTLPASTGQSDWTEVTYDVDPAGSSIEISAYLSAGQSIAFEKIVLAVDTQLPKNGSAACEKVPSSPSSSSLPTSLPPISGVTTGKTVSVTTRSTDINQQCPPPPTPTECKCNCLCNCNKC